MQTQTRAEVANMQIKIPSAFESGKQYIPIGEQFDLNGKSIPAIPKFLDPPNSGGILISNGGQLSWLSTPSGGTYVLGSVGGTPQWLATESCD